MIIQKEPLGKTASTPLLTGRNYIQYTLCTHGNGPGVGVELWLHRLEELDTSKDFDPKDEAGLEQDALQPSDT